MGTVEGKGAHLDPAGAAKRRAAVAAGVAPVLYGAEGCGEGGHEVRAVAGEEEEAAEVVARAAVDHQIRL